MRSTAARQHGGTAARRHGGITEGIRRVAVPVVIATGMALPFKATAQAPQCNNPGSTYDWSEVEAEVDDKIGGLLQPTGASLRILVDGTEELCATFGSGAAANPGNEIQVYSVSKWIAATVVMTLVQDNLLSLDDFVTDILDDVIFTSASWDDVQVKHLLSHTSGLPHLLGVTDSCSGLPIMTLKACARIIALVPLLDDPDKSFRYGGPGWQMLAAVAEEVTGQAWDVLLENRLTGTGKCDWGMGYPSAINPNVSAGIRSNLFDLSDFTEMQRTGFCKGGTVQILTQGSLTDMRQAQTDHIFNPPDPEENPTIISPYSDGRNYGLGLFLTDGADYTDFDIFLHPGAGGIHPWINIEHGYSAVLFLNANPINGYVTGNGIFDAIIKLIEDQVDGS